MNFNDFVVMLSESSFPIHTMIGEWQLKLRNLAENWNKKTDRSQYCKLSFPHRTHAYWQCGRIRLVDFTQVIAGLRSDKNSLETALYEQQQISANMETRKEQLEGENQELILKKESLQSKYRPSI